MCQQHYLCKRMLRKDTKRVFRADMLESGIVSVVQLPCTTGSHEDRTTAILIADIAMAGQHHTRMQAASLARLMTVTPFWQTHRPSARAPSGASCATPARRSLMLRSGLLPTVPQPTSRLSRDTAGRLSLLPPPPPTNGAAWAAPRSTADRGIRSYRLPRLST